MEQTQQGQKQPELTAEKLEECKKGLENIVSHLIELAVERKDHILTTAGDVLNSLFALEMSPFFVKASESDTEEERKAKSLNYLHFSSDCVAFVILSHYKALQFVDAEKAKEAGGKKYADSIRFCGRIPNREMLEAITDQHKEGDVFCVYNYVRDDHVVMRDVALMLVGGSWELMPNEEVEKEEEKND